MELLTAEFLVPFSSTLSGLYWFPLPWQPAVAGAGTPAVGKAVWYFLDAMGWGHWPWRPMQCHSPSSAACCYGHPWGNQLWLRSRDWLGSPNIPPHRLPYIRVCTPAWPQPTHACPQSPAAQPVWATQRLLFHTPLPTSSGAHRCCGIYTQHELWYQNCNTSQMLWWMHGITKYERIFVHPSYYFGRHHPNTRSMLS